MAIILIFLFLITLCKSDVCPKQCDCDMDDGLNRAICESQNIVSIDVGVPKSVQVYSLSHNVINELDNYCFMEAGYTSLEILTVSYNLIFWVGLHAFTGLPKLNHVDLNNNRLRYIPSDIFMDTPELDYLDLSGNIFESLKNEPFLMHTKLQVLNLNNCRIKSVPERLFTRLPNLKKLDLSENYMISITIDALRPLKKLARVELRNDYWQCNPDVIAVETWIVSHGITYEKMCKKKSPKMSEKMISIVKEDRKEVDITKVWNVTLDKNETLPSLQPTKKIGSVEKLNTEFPSLQSFILGLEIGLAVGVVGTYIWLRRLCTCGHLKIFNRRQTQRRRRQRMGETESLWQSIINPDMETPPIARRQLSLPEQSAPFPTYGLPEFREAALRVDAIRVSNRAETPPPPYNECRYV